MPFDAPPSLRDLPDAVASAEPFLERARTARGSAYVNDEGGDVDGNGSTLSLARHVAHYLAAAEIVDGRPTRVVDVGSGVGALGAWLAARLGDVPLHLVDHSPALRGIAEAAFPTATVHADTAELSPEAGSLVTAMEVIEHIEPSAHADFVASLWHLVGPGGTLVLSTPDETGFHGGWSGYAPHIGCLDAEEFCEVVATATGARVTVWRLYGEPYTVGPVRRLVQPTANRAWGAVSGRLPSAAMRFGAAVTPVVGAVAARLPAADRPAPTVFAAPATPEEPPAANVNGNGLLAAVERPA